MDALETIKVVSSNTNLGNMGESPWEWLGRDSVSNSWGFISLLGIYICSIGSVYSSLRT